MNESEKKDSRTGAVPVFGPKSQISPEQESPANVPPPPPPPMASGTQPNGGPPTSTRPVEPNQRQPHRTARPAAHQGTKYNSSDFSPNMQTSGVRIWPFVVGGAGLIALILIVVLVASVVNMTTSDDGSVDAAPGTSEAEQGDAEEADPVDAMEGKDLSPEEQLESLKDATWDSYADELDGEWVVQLSSKKDGLEADGYTWTNSDIVEHYGELHEMYPEAVLLWSGDWSSYDSSDFWVIVLSTTYSDSDSALDFCNQEGFGEDDCMAKQLFITGAPEDTSEYMS